uniref:Zinc finger, CCHC-type n=1 Tax=Tanacetum cinerariifolium TaxID=118510 RepID=A0A6L2N0M2_TANCI|nr:zinc finger, CCHC-type [Tanacetum cinerariifolium]
MWKILSRLNLYLDHLDMDLSEYLSQAITTEMDAGISKTICPPKKRYCNNFSMDEMVDWAEMKVEQIGGSSQHPQKTNKGKDATEGVEAKTSNIDKGKDKTEGVKARTSTTDKSKEKVGKKYVTVDQFKECLTYYALANGFSLLYERSSGKKVVTKCGQRPSRFWHVILIGGNLFEVTSESEGFTVDEGKRTCSYKMCYIEPILEQTLKLEGVPGRPRKKKAVINLEDGDVDVDVHVRSIVRDEDVGGSKGGAGGVGAGESKGGTGASVSKRKQCEVLEHKIHGKKKAGTSGFAKWFGLLDEPGQTKDDQAQTQDELVQRQDEDQTYELAHFLCCKPSLLLKTPKTKFTCLFSTFTTVQATRTYNSNLGDVNLIRTLGDYSRPSHEGFRNTIQPPEGNNVVPIRSDIIWLVQNGCSFYELRSEDPNQHLKDFLKLLDSLDLDGANRERTRLRLFQFSLRDQARNWLERLPAGSIFTWEDLTTRFLAQFFLPGRTVKLRNDILMFQQHHGESLSEAWTRFKDLLQKEPVSRLEYGITLAAHTKRMERFENAIFKHRKEINDRIEEKFMLLKELTASMAPEKVLIREEAKYHVTKNINSISLTRREEEKNDEYDVTNVKDIEKNNGSDKEIPVKKSEKENEA